MKILKEALIAIVLLFSLFIIPSSGTQSFLSISSSGTINTSGHKGLKWLHTNGTHIVDGDDNPIILRGANFMGYEFGAWDSHTEEDYARMVSWGFNVVRLPIAWSYIEPEPGVYNSSYFDFVDRDIQWAGKHGLYLILDMHQWKWSPHFTYGTSGRGNGLPTWMVAAYPNSREGMGQAVMDFMLGKGPNGTDANETNPSMQERLVNVWKLIAQRYVNEPTIAAYELFNEPYHSSDLIDGGLTPTETAVCLFPFYGRLIEGIRTEDSNHIIAYQPVGGWDSGRAQKLNYSNLIYTFHFYGASPSYNCTKEELKEAFMYRYSPPYDWQSNPSKWNIPIWLGEFGTDAGSWNPRAGEYARDMVDILGEIPIGWAWWVYWKSDTYGKALLYANGTERTEFTTYLRVNP